ncbi:membrane protein PM19L-like [Euphorbia lathyris]|uniref:membrane protein PM19L-like n=1 Tax=Euphorbia lathyris TaxID=212925 RepID=UPI003313B33E
MAGGGEGRVQRDLIGPLLAVNFVFNLIVLGLAAWSLDKYINGEQNHPHLGGNPSTSFMLVFALTAGVIGASSVIVGVLHYRTWTDHTLASATSTAILSFAITALAFGLVCKQIILGGRRGKRLKTLEALITISLLSQFLYVVLLHAGILNHRYGPGFRGQDRSQDRSVAMSDQPQKTSTPQVI